MIFPGAASRAGRATLARRPSHGRFVSPFSWIAPLYISFVILHTKQRGRHESDFTAHRPMAKATPRRMAKPWRRMASAAAATSAGGRDMRCQGPPLAAARAGSISPIYDRTREIVTVVTQLRSLNCDSVHYVPFQLLRTNWSCHWG